MAAHSSLGEGPDVSRLGGQITLCASAQMDYDLAATRLLRSRDSEFAETPVAGHLLESNTAVSATFASVAAASRAMDPVLATVAGCTSDITQDDGTTSHDVGSRVSASAPFAAVVKLLATGSYPASGRAQFRVDFMGRVHNAMFGCESQGLDRGAVERAASECLAASARAALIGAPLAPTTPDTVVPDLAVRTAVGRAEIPGTTMASALGASVICVIEPAATARRPLGAAVRVGFAAPEDGPGQPSTIVQSAAFPSVDLAVARMAEEDRRASSCAGRVSHPDPKFVPTFVVGHGKLVTTGAFVAWEERYATGTVHHVEQVSRAGSVVLYVQGSATSAAQARARADRATSEVRRQLVAD